MNRVKTKRELTNEIIEFIKDFNYKPEVIDSFLNSQCDLISTLPVSHLIEIQTTIETYVAKA